MWEVPADKLKIQLPPGFSLKQDVNSFYLFYEGEAVADFSATGNDPSEIEKRAKSFLDRIEWNKTAHGL